MGAHGLSGVQAAAIAIENALTRAFGPGVGASFHTLLETVQNAPATFEAITTSIKDISTTFQTLRKDLALLTISASNLPGVGAGFKTAADAARAEFNIPAPTALDQIRGVIGGSVP